jgi:hypothetical protein
MPGREFETKCKKQAVGFRHGQHVKLVCAFDPDTFSEIRKLAVKARTSVAEQVRILVEFGLTDLA